MKAAPYVLFDSRGRMVCRTRKGCKLPLLFRSLASAERARDDWAVRHRYRSRVTIGVADVVVTLRRQQKGTAA